MLLLTTLVTKIFVFKSKIKRARNDFPGKLTEKEEENQRNLTHLESVVEAVELQELCREATELGRRNLTAIVGPTPEHGGRTADRVFQLQNLSLKVVFRLRLDEFSRGFVDGAD